MTVQTTEDNSSMDFWCSDNGSLSEEGDLYFVPTLPVQGQLRDSGWSSQSRYLSFVSHKNPNSHRNCRANSRPSGKGWLGHQSSTTSSLHVRRPKQLYSCEEKVKEGSVGALSVSESYCFKLCYRSISPWNF